jgi:hypothetical protein
MVGDTVLFYQSGMDSLETHVVNITNLDNRVLAIDYAEIVTLQGGSEYVASICLLEAVSSPFTSGIILRVPTLHQPPHPVASISLPSLVGYSARSYYS